MSKVIPNFTDRRYIVNAWYDFIYGKEVDVPNYVEEILRESHSLIDTIPPQVFWITNNLLFQVLPGQVIMGHNKAKPSTYCNKCNEKVSILKTKLLDIRADWCLKCGTLVFFRLYGIEFPDNIKEWIQKAREYLKGDLRFIKDCVGTRQLLKFDSRKKRWIP